MKVNEDMSQRFVGVWKLVSVEFHRGDQITYPYGQDPIGYIMYTGDGYMSVHVMASERRPFASGDYLDGTLEEYADAGKTYAGYCGTYEVHDNTIIHHVDASSVPQWVGVQFVRHVTFDGDTLRLSTTPMLMEGQLQTAHLVPMQIPAPVGCVESRSQHLPNASGVREDRVVELLHGGRLAWHSH